MPAKTVRLEHEDPFLARFDARVVAHASFAGRPSVVLDRSAFYPESGGQLADHGRLGGARVVDVQIDEGGAVHHLLEDGAPLPALGEAIAGEVDRVRRRLHMSLHTGQHMLSRALVDVASAETASSRLGESACTIDVVAGATLDERAVGRAEDLVNAVIDDDVAIRAYFPSDAELAALPLRRAPKVTENVRVVSIGEFDVTPCGGTHCVRSAQVGLLRVTALERYKGSMRVTFSAGPRARRELSVHDEALRSLARSLTCAPTDVAQALERVRRELETTREGLGRARSVLAQAAAEDLWSDAERVGDPHVIAAFDEGGVEFLRAVSARLVTKPRAVALLAMRSPDGVHVLVDRATDSGFDCGGFVKMLASKSGGRGGGRVDHAEGRLPVGVDWAALVRGLLAS